MLWVESPQRVVLRLDDRAFTQDTFAEFLLTDRGGADADAEMALDQLIEETLVEEEARRRGIDVGDAELDRRLQKLRLQLQRSGGQTLEEFLRQQNMTVDSFRAMLAKSIACEWMMRADYGLDPDEPLDEAKQKLWLKEQKDRTSIERPRDHPHLAVRVGSRERTRVEWALKLAAILPASDILRLREEFITVQLLARAAEEARIVIDARVIGEELALRDALLKNKLQEQGLPTEGVTYVGMLEARGKSRDELLRSTRFLAEIQQRLLAEKRFGGDGYAAFHAQHRDLFERRFGERVRASILSLRVGRRTADESRSELQALIDRMRSSAEPLPAQFERLARIYSEHSSREQGGDLGFLSREAAARMQLEEALFGARVGDLIGPLVSAEGAHVLLVGEFRAAEPFVKILPQIKEEARRVLVQQLREQAHIEELW